MDVSRTCLTAPHHKNTPRQRQQGPSPASALPRSRLHPNTRPRLHCTAPRPQPHTAPSPACCRRPPPHKHTCVTCSTPRSRSSCAIACSISRTRHRTKVATPPGLPITAFKSTPVPSEGVAGGRAGWAVGGRVSREAAALPGMPAA
mgnify:CR=1 FL=1